MGISRQNRVEVKSMLTAISSKPTRSGQVHTFTALDNAMSPHTVHVIFYYPRSPFKSFDLDSVRIPLSELLSMYPPAIGRVNKNQDGILEVKCNDAGLRVLKAKVSVGIDEWLRSADGHEESDLTAWEDMPEDPSTWSPFRLQINEFEGGGVAIGLSCPHMHADATTLTVLLKSWTEAQRRQCIVHPPSFSPLPSNVTDTNAVTSFSKPISGPVSTKTATATFRFSSSAFTRCVKEHSIDEISPKATPFSVFAALFWTRVALVKDKSDRVCVCVDFRRLLPNPLPYGFFGNALNFSSLEMANVVNMGVGHVARLVNEHVASLNVEKIRSGLKRAGSQGKMYGNDLTIVNMEHMIVDGEPLMYEAVFEEGVRPMHVSYRIGNDGGEGVITVIPSSEKGFGRTVSVTLPEEEMKKLLSDQEILRLEPEIILKGVK
ncbi:unnamed protein product [Eruca vesicaria subsp. sativa]|uniref:Uncharacterized protein n=1 Tax=Eruca vesicaria subsp. sativa TaxID=29727 RepID=A0ABC8IXI8_ERUVS|nr:unnamed protein product [Eruca vesicaria subsp. sativa]